MKNKATIYIVISILIFFGYLVYINKNIIVKYIKQNTEFVEKKEKAVKKKVKKKIKIKEQYKKYLDIQTKNLTKEQKERLKSIITSWLYQTYPRLYYRLAKEIANHLVEKTRMSLFLIGLAGAESSFITQNTSSAKAYGLCQIRYSIWSKEAPKILKKFGVNSYKELYDPIKNLEVAEFIIMKYIKMSSGNIVDALVKYQTGKKNLKSLGPKQRLSTKRYINKIFAICGKLYVNIALKQ